MFGAQRNPLSTDRLTWDHRSGTTTHWHDIITDNRPELALTDQGGQLQAISGYQKQYSMTRRGSD